MENFHRLESLLLSQLRLHIDDLAQPAYSKRVRSGQAKMWRAES